MNPTVSALLRIALAALLLLSSGQRMWAQPLERPSQPMPSPWKPMPKLRQWVDSPGQRLGEGFAQGQIETAWYGLRVVGLRATDADYTPLATDLAMGQVSGMMGLLHRLGISPNEALRAQGAAFGTCVYGVVRRSDVGERLLVAAARLDGPRYHLALLLVPKPTFGEPDPNYEHLQALEQLLWY